MANEVVVEATGDPGRTEGEANDGTQRVIESVALRALVGYVEQRDAQPVTDDFHDAPDGAEIEWSEWGSGFWCRSGDCWVPAGGVR